MEVAERWGEEIRWTTMAPRARGLKLTCVQPRRDPVDLGASLYNLVFGEQKPQSTEINLLEALYLLSKVLG